MRRVILILVLGLSVAAAVYSGYVILESAKTLDEISVIRTPSNTSKRYSRQDKKGKQDPSQGEFGDISRKLEPGEEEALKYGEGTKRLLSQRVPKRSLVEMGELFVNVNHPDEVHYLKLDLTLEMFGEADRQLVLSNKAGLRNVFIEVAREHDFDQLATLAGKLYFKEVVVSRMNTFLKVPALREVYFARFFLR